MQEGAQNSWERERLLEALEAFNRGVGDAPLLRKWSKASPRDETSSHDENGIQEHSMAFVLSTDEVDRHGDVVSAEGWNLASYRSNPVFLWAHDYARPVIGRAVDTWLEPHRLMARMDFAPTQFAQEVAGLYRAGYQRGVSVGFKPLRYEERRHESTGAILGIRFLEQELLEVSAVPVPANRDALRRAMAEAPNVAEYLRRKASESEDTLPPARFATALQAAWPVLSAQVDELAKLAGELAQAAADVDRDVWGQSTAQRANSSLPDLLEALKEAYR